MTSLQSQRLPLILLGRREISSVAAPSHDSSAFDLQRAQRLAIASEISYAGPKRIESVMRQQLGYESLRFIDIDGTECFVAAGRDDIIVSFRGTEPTELSDWITDLDFDLVPGPLGGRVHEGFYDALSDVWHVVDSTVSNFSRPESKPLLVTGHSLGGALATLAVARWLQGGRAVAGLYTFGQPRTGDEEFARNFNFMFKPYAFRIVNNNDIATRVPPRCCDYRHIGRFRYLTEPGILESDISWWQRFLDRCHGKIEDIFEWGGDGIKDHSITVYRQLIEFNLGKTQKSIRSTRKTKIELIDRGRRLIRPRKRRAA